MAIITENPRLWVWSGEAPKQPEVRGFVDQWLEGDTLSNYTKRQGGYLASITDAAELAAKIYAHKFRKNNPSESVFYHVWRVAERANIYTDGDPLIIFCALAHDLVEDTRKLPPDQQVTVQQVVDLWRGDQWEKDAIAAILTYKTDAVGLKGDARRDAQLRVIEQTNEMLFDPYTDPFDRYVAYGVQILFLADKFDNLETDIRDARATPRRLNFSTREGALEWALKKINDAAVVHKTSLPEDLKKPFVGAYFSLLEDITKAGGSEPSFVVPDSEKEMPKIRIGWVQTLRAVFRPTISFVYDRAASSLTSVTPSWMSDWRERKAARPSRPSNGPEMEEKAEDSSCTPV